MRRLSRGGFDAAALDRVQQALALQIERQRIPGAVCLIERSGRTACLWALGAQDPGRGLPMRADSIFRIFSMTKPVVSVALMRQFEQGRVLLSDRVDRYLPDFAAPRVGVPRDGGGFDLVAARRPMTVQDLLRHTAGLTYEFHELSAVRKRYLAAQLHVRERDNAQHVAQLAALPLMHEPGSAFDYSRATDVLGRLVEVLTDRPLGEHLHDAIFAPLGMVDTGFRVPEREHPRLAEPFARAAQGRLLQPLFDPRVHVALECAGDGLLSTAPDYARFLRMLSQGGTLDGVRLLGARTVTLMTSDHLGTIERTGGVLPPGHGFGLGVAVKTLAGLDTEPGSVGSYGWSGAAGTSFFVDPAQSMFAVLLMQAPDVFDEVRERFRNMVYAALDD